MILVNSISKKLVNIQSIKTLSSDLKLGNKLTPSWGLMEVGKTTPNSIYTWYGLARLKVKFW